MEYPGALSHLPARGIDQQTIFHDEPDRTDFLTRLGQEALPQRWRSAKSSNNPARALQTLLGIASQKKPLMLRGLMKPESK